MKKWKCTICSYIHENGEPPEICPICKVPKEKFVPYSDENIQGVIPRDIEKRDIPLPGISSFVTKQHLHPISIHVPNGVLPLAVFFIIAGFFFNNPDFLVVARYNMIAVLLFMPFVIFTGLVSWQYKYKGVMTKLFKTKIYCSYVALGASLLSVGINAYYPPEGDRTVLYYIFYIILHAILLGVTGWAGFLGGKLVFKK